MTRPAAALISVLAAASVAAGCAGRDTSYTLRETRDCLGGEEGVRLAPTPHSDFIASNALGGSVLARVGTNAVVISFGLDERGAARIASAYRRARGPNIGIRDILRPTGNAVLLWKEHPEQEDEERITGCLR